MFTTSRSAYLHAFRLATTSIIATVKVVAWGIERLASYSARNRAEPEAAQNTRMEHEFWPVLAWEPPQALSIPLVATFKHSWIWRGGTRMEEVALSNEYARLSRPSSSLKDIPRFMMAVGSDHTVRVPEDQSINPSGASSLKIYFLFRFLLPLNSLGLLGV
jgi:hypothetical protein